MAKLVRPVVDIMRRWPDSSSMTMAVEESARQVPMISDAAGGRPSHSAPRPMGSAVSEDLQPAQPEHQPAHGEQAAHRQLQPDEEQQEDDAEVGDEADLPLAGDGDPVDGARILGETAEAVRAQRRADDEEAQDRAYFQAVHHRRHDGRRAQNDQGVLEAKISVVPAIGRNIDCEGRSVHTFLGSEEKQTQGMETT